MALSCGKSGSQTVLSNVYTAACCTQPRDSGQCSLDEALHRRKSSG